MAEKGKYIYDWPRPMVTVDAVVFAFFGHAPSLLLIKRKNDPFRGKWAIPGGFVDLDEELETAVARELAEETGLLNVGLQQMHTFGRCGRDPRGRQITIAYIGIATDGVNDIKGGDDAEEAQWFDIENLPEDLAFDHKEVAEFAIERLKQQTGHKQKSE